MLRANSNTPLPIAMISTIPRTLCFSGALSTFSSYNGTCDVEGQVLHFVYAWKIQSVDKAFSWGLSGHLKAQRQAPKFISNFALPVAGTFTQNVVHLFLPPAGWHWPWNGGVSNLSKRHDHWQVMLNHRAPGSTPRAPPLIIWGGLWIIKC